MIMNLHGEILWFENIGAPADGMLWQAHMITDRLPGAYVVTAVNFDGDGDLDVAASS